MQEIRAFQPLPDYVKRLSDEDYYHWARLHNILAIERAQREADEFEKRNPPTTVYIERFKSNGRVDGNRWGSSRYNHGHTFESYAIHPPRWGGGPVLILNPYCR